MKTHVALAVVALLSGCASADKFADAFENRVTCTHARDAAWVVSRYWRLGVAAEVSARDVPTLCATVPATPPAAVAPTRAAASGARP